MSIAAPRATHRYAMLWRWHFYAGLFTAPFLVILSITGAIYLFNDELNDLIYPELRFASSTAPAQPASALVAAVTAHWPESTVTRIDMPLAEGRSAMLFVTPEDGPPFRAFVDPGDARVLGSFVYTSTLVGFADVFHGSLMLGDVGDAIVELASCWALVLVLTGLYLWWPRGAGRADKNSDKSADKKAGKKDTSRRGRVLPNLTLRGRRLWREVHRFTGFYTALLIIFLILSGLPWATVWGGMVLQPVSNALGLGYPSQYRHHGSAASETDGTGESGESGTGTQTEGESGTPTHSHTRSQTLSDTMGDAPWALEQAPLPRSAHAHAHHGTTPGADGTAPPDVGVDHVVDVLAAQGMESAYRLSLPRDGHHLYSGYTYPDRPEGQRTLHVDRYTGEVLADIRFEDYGAVAKLVEWGVAIHMGNYWGRANQLVMLFTCIAIVGLVFTGLVMWWRRRPAGGLGAPRAPSPIRPRNLALVTLILLLVFPLTGLSLLVILAAEALWSRFARRPRNT